MKWRNVNTEIKLRSLMWARHVARTGETMNAHRIIVLKNYREGRLSSSNGNISLVWGCSLRSSGSGRCPVAVVTSRLCSLYLKACSAWSKNWRSVCYVAYDDMCIWKLKLHSDFAKCLYLWPLSQRPWRIRQLRPGGGQQTLGRCDVTTTGDVLPTSPCELLEDYFVCQKAFVSSLFVCLFCKTGHFLEAWRMRKVLATAPITRYRRVKTSQEAARRETAVVRATGELLAFFCRLT
jgi:hypothetical protein